MRRTLCFSEFDDPHYMQQFHYRVGGVEFEPAFRKIRIVGFFMVVVLKKLAQHQEIEWEGVFAMIVVVKIGIAVLVPAPVYNGAMDRTHQKVYRQ